MILLAKTLEITLRSNCIWIARSLEVCVLQMLEQMSAGATSSTARQGKSDENISRFVCEEKKMNQPQMCMCVSMTDYLRKSVGSFKH